MMMTSCFREDTARQIVQRTMNIIDHSVNVMSEQGVIIASGDPRRLHQRQYAGARTFKAASL